MLRPDINQHIADSRCKVKLHNFQRGTIPLETAPHFQLEILKPSTGGPLHQRGPHPGGEPGRPVFINAFYRPSVAAKAKRKLRYIIAKPTQVS